MRKSDAIRRRLSDRVSACHIKNLRSWTRQIGQRGKLLGENLRRDAGTWLFYLPGFFLIFTAFALLIAPRLFLAAVALLLFFAGMVVCIVTSRVLRFKNRLEAMARGFEAQVLIHRPRPREQAAPDLRDDEDKKIILH